MKLEDMVVGKVGGNARLLEKKYLTEEERLSCEPATRANVSAFMIAVYLDEELESANYHSFVGMYMRLLDSLNEFCSYSDIKNVMFDLLEAGVPLGS